MARDDRFTFACNEKERRLLAAVAKELKRSQSDTMRFLLHGAAEELGVVQDGERAPAGGKRHDTR